MKSVSTVLTFTDKSFTDSETGDRIDYTEVVAKINGEPIRFKVSKDDKSLLRALLRSVPETK